MINHRYHIVNPLGEGGNAQVFLVEDTLERGQRSAMKVFHRQSLDARAELEHIWNEIAILATLHHPNLVHVFDFGVVRSSEEKSLLDRRFLTMEYIQGVSADAWCRTVPSGQDRATHLKHVLLQVLQVLAYVHRRGIIHFDIKPDNLLVISGGESGSGLPLVKLTDFGFSVHMGTAHELSLRGTLEYTAPELLRRDPFDHRVDLYSLGVTLYELMEGRCPFEEGNPVELIKKVLTTKPEFQQSLDPAYSLLLPLLKGLLHEDPSHRFESAGQAARFLLPEGGGLYTAGFDIISKPVFVGRETEKSRIGRALSALGTEHAGEPETAILMTGPEGIGKTALVSEVVRQARTADVPVVEVKHAQRHVPFSAARSLLSILKAEVLSRSARGPELTERFADVIDPRAEHGDGETGEFQTGWLLEREKTIESQARFINQASLLFPVVIVVDDVDVLDGESMEVLRTVHRDGTPGRLLLLLTAPRVSDLPFAASEIPLGELDAETVVAMSTSTISPPTVGEAIGLRLHLLYGGTPSILVEALYSAGKLLYGESLDEIADRSGLAEKVTLKLPRDLDQFLLKRYQSLDRGLQLTLDVLSCFSGSARLEVVEAVLPFQRQRTQAYLSLLEAHGLITSHDAGKRFAVRHTKLKALINSALQDARPATHLFIASTLEGIAGARSFDDLQELAYQYTQAGQSVEALLWLEAAGDEGTQLSAHQQAGQLYRRAMDLSRPADGVSVERLTVKLAESLFRGGAFRDAIELATHVLGTELLDATHTTVLHKIAGLAQSRLGEYREGKKHIETALETCGDARENVELTQELVGIDIALGSFLEAEQASIVQLDRAKSLGNQLSLAAIYTDLGIATFFQELYDRSIEYFRESMEIYISAKHHMHAVDAQMNIGNVMSAKGRIADAIECWSEALRQSQEYGTLNQQAQILNNIGIAHFKLKRFREARSFYNNAKTLFHRLDSKQGSAYILTNLGEVGFAEGQYEPALLMWKDALQHYYEMHDSLGIVETLLQLAQVHLVLGDGVSASAILGEAEALVKSKNLESFRAHMLFVRGMSLMLLGNHDAARSAFMDAEERMQESGDIAQRLLLAVRMAECDHHRGEVDSAVALARHALELGETHTQPNIIAEACLLLGTIAKASPSRVQEKALLLFRTGFEAIAEEPVTEVTWKLAMALGGEFHARGQREKAKGFLSQAKLVLQFFLSHFASSELRNQYLAAGSKDAVMKNLDSFLTT